MVIGSALPRNDNAKRLRSPSNNNMSSSSGYQLLRPPIGKAKPALQTSSLHAVSVTSATNTPSSSSTPKPSKLAANQQTHATTAVGGQALSFPYPRRTNVGSNQQQPASNNKGDDWEAEMKHLQQVDNWVKLSNENTPPDLAERFRDFIEQYPLIVRISFYQLMSSLGWNRGRLKQLLAIFERLGNLQELIKMTVDHLNEMALFYQEYPECKDMFITTLQFLFDLPHRYVDPLDAYRAQEDNKIVQPSTIDSFIVTQSTNAFNTQSSSEQSVITEATSSDPQANLEESTSSPNRIRRHRVTIESTNELIYFYIKEYLVNLSMQDQYFLMNVIRLLPPFEYKTLLNYIPELSIASILQQIQSLDTRWPNSQQCQLCRSQRLARLEFRMRQNQLPKDVKTQQEMLPVVGNLALWEKQTQQWQADDETLFSFDFATERIVWDRMIPVNLVEICDGCLQAAHKALTNRTGHEEMHHLEGEAQKQALLSLRRKEKMLSTAMIHVSKERTLRRVKEFAAAAVKCTRQGLIQEATIRENRRIEQERLAQWARDEAAKKAMIDAALIHDKEWAIHDEESAQRDLSLRLDYAAMNKQLAFSAKNKPAPIRRESERSFRLKETDDQGLPLTAQAAKERFGTSEPRLQVDDDKLINSWKSMASFVGNILQAERDRQAAVRREQELGQLQTIRNFIEEKSVLFNRRQEQLKHLAEEREQHRLQRRAFDKQERRRLRFEEYLANERNHFLFEDNRSHHLRFYLCERERETREREDMFDEECCQREIDRFWGIDAFHKRMREEELRLRKFYEERVRKANAPLMLLKQTQRVKAKDIDLVTFGTLQEDVCLAHDDKSRREAVIRRLAAEEIRSKLKRRYGGSVARPGLSGP